MIRTIALTLAAVTGGSAVTIPEGTDIPITLDEDVPWKQDRVGDTFEARVTRDVVADGEVVIVRGAPCTWMARCAR